ncbi:MAG: 5'-3' exonuclease [bacterium]|nr:5'-3' exonuclease [bacterium]
MLLLVDYSSLLYRAFHSLPESLPARGVYGILGMLARLVQDRRPRGLGICVDDDWRPAFRVEALPSYKAHRVAEVEAEADPVAADEAIGRAVLQAIGVAVLGAEGYEAEDVIATLAAHTRARVEVVSGDRDCFALVEDPHVSVLYPVRGVSELAVIDEAAVTKRYGIPGRAYLDFALLRGDPSDGLPGVAGIGEKTAAQLVARYGSLDAVLAALDAGDRALSPAVAHKLAAGRDYLAAARRVVPPCGAVPLPAISLDLPTATAHPRTLARLTAEHGLQTPVERFARALGLATASA